MIGLDLFSGIGGLTKALEGYVKPVAYCENDRYAQAVLLSRMAVGDIPKAPIWDDVKTLSKTHIAPPVDIIYGGFPCQDISTAGRGAGLEGERSGLFFQIVRLVSEIRPQFVFLENVAAITFRGGERIVAEFCELGYDCRWGILSASDVGANHQRARWWLLAYSMPTEQRRDEWKEEIKNDASNASSIRTQRRIPNGIRTVVRNDGNAQPLADATIYGLEERWKAPWNESVRSNSSGWWEIEPHVDRVANGVPFRVDRLKGLGNAVVPAQAREAFERLMGLKRSL